MKNKEMIALCFFLCFCQIYSASIKTITFDQKDLVKVLGPLEQKIFAGEIHYARIPVQYWEHRIQMVKAMGLNALSVYVMWNHHEIQRGVFDYQTENKNLSLFLDLAQKYKMKVLLRPGPYVCAEWDLGGMPARLLSIEPMQLRSNHETFLEEVRLYFSSLVEIIKKHQYSEKNTNGSIILLQIENQYGFYDSDKSYIEALRKIWFDLGVEVPEYYVDTVQNIQKCHWKGAHIGINGAIVENQYLYARTFEKQGIVFGGQIYTGWQTHWGEQWGQKNIEKNQKQFQFLMQKNHSYSMYMVHGGTNFGLTAGGNGFSGQRFDYRGHITSYDYDAPINEQGSPTDKFKALKTLIKKFAKWQIPAEPSPLKTIEIPSFKLNPVGHMLNNLKKPDLTDEQRCYRFESQELKLFKQGFVVYETKLERRRTRIMGVVHDYGLVYLDDQFVTTLDRSQYATQDFEVDCQNDRCTLRIVVEAMGHINFGKEMNTDYKGILTIKDDKGTDLRWDMYRVPLEEDDVLNWGNYDSNKKNAPTLLHADIQLSEVGDVYLDASEFKKGYIWVNGRNLGRYWSKGPQNRLFCPGVWLKNGTNSIHVLELHYDGSDKSLSGKKSLQSVQKEGPQEYIQ